MGFPIVYTDVFLPRLVIHLLTFLGFIRKFVCALLSFFGLGHALEPDTVPYRIQYLSASEIRSISAALIREVLPVVRYSDLAEGTDTRESCAVCLYEFGGEDEIRRLSNCRHIFHRSCLDRWMDHGQRTCPLCRTPFIPEGMEEFFNERVWVESGVSDSFGEHSPVTVGWC